MMEATIQTEHTVIQVYAGFKDLMTYKEAIAYMGKSESWFKDRLKMYCVGHNSEGFYAKTDLDRIKNGQKKTA